MLLQELLTASNLLVHFNPMTLACDASAYGIGAHRMPDGSEKSVGYVSRMLTWCGIGSPHARRFKEASGICLTDAEKNYS